MGFIGNHAEGANQGVHAAQTAAMGGEGSLPSIVQAMGATLTPTDIVPHGAGSLLTTETPSASEGAKVCHTGGAGAVLPATFNDQQHNLTLPTRT